MDKSEEDKKTYSYWIIGLIFLAFFDISCQANQDYSKLEGGLTTPHNLGYIAGGFIMTVLVSWLVLYGVFGRNLARSRGVVAFGVLFLSALLGTGVGVVRSFGKPTVEENRQLDLIKTYMADLMQVYQQDAQVYQSNLEKAGWFTLFDIERIGKDKRLKESKQIIERSKKAVDDYKRSTLHVLDSFQQAFLALDVLEEIRQGFLEGSNKSRMFFTDSLWAMDAEIVTHVESMFVILEAEEGSWRVRNGMLEFDDLAVENRFRVLERKIALIKDKQAQRQQEMKKI